MQGSYAAFGNAKWFNHILVLYWSVTCFEQWKCPAPLVLSSGNPILPYVTRVQGVHCLPMVVIHSHLCYLYSTTVLTLAGRYIAGKEIEKYNDHDRSLSTLEKYLDEKAGLPPYLHRSSQLSDIDDEPSIKKTFNQDGRVLALEPSTFWVKVSSEPTFIKYYAPWCHHCRNLAPTWTELAAALTGIVNVAEVDCDAHGTFCRKQEVEGFPVLKLWVPLSAAVFVGSWC